MDPPAEEAQMADAWGIRRWLDELRGRTMYRRRRVIESPQSREVVVDGRPLLNFCGNDYLGLAGDPRLAEALAAGAARWGTGAGASHLVCGHTAVHHELEEALADFVGRPRALLFSTGYAANTGAINGLLTRATRSFRTASITPPCWTAAGSAVRSSAGSPTGTSPISTRCWASAAPRGASSS